MRHGTGSGQAVTSTVTSGEMCRAAGLDWKVTKEPAPGARIVNERRKLHDRYLIVRDAVGNEEEAVALGIVNPGAIVVHGSDQII